MSLFDDFKYCYGSATSCGECNRNPQFTVEDVNVVLWGKDFDPQRDNGTHRMYLVELVDSSYGLIEEWTDYTGHGCQCGGFTARYNSVYSALKYGIGDTNPDTYNEALAALTQADISLYDN